VSARAVVTITCPKCGGEVSGVRLVDAATTVPCKYCGTDLHVPHVGAAREVVREKETVREVVVRAPDEVPMTPERRRAVWIALALLLVGSVIAVGITLSSSSARVNEMNESWKRREACRAECEQQCGFSPAAPATTVTVSRVDPYLDPALDRQVREAEKQANAAICSANCSNKCQ
jgi:hypothetical protein